MLKITPKWAIEEQIEREKKEKRRDEEQLKTLEYIAFVLEKLDAILKALDNLNKRICKLEQEAVHK